MVVRTGGLPFSTPPCQQQQPPDLARKSARRIQRAQERMQAAVLAAEAERSETFSGRSTEDTEVRALL
jgi:hypothetical protein